MRKIVTAAAAGLCLGAAMVAGAGGPDGGEPEARAYVNFSFDGARDRSRQYFFYGLRLDHAAGTSSEPLPPIAQVQFTRAGFADARLNGVPFAYRSVRLNQDAGTIGAPGAEPAAVTSESADSEGGDVSDADTAADSGSEETAPGDDAAADDSGMDDTASAEESAEDTASAEDSGSEDSYGDDSGSQDGGGSETAFTALDWGLLVAGAVGLGFLVTEVADSEESPDPGSGGNTGGSTGGTTGEEECVPGPPPLCMPLAGGMHRTPETRTDAEYQQWLDGGTGHMGDLVAQ